MATLYLDCPAGIAGDMAVAALLDLGASQEVLEAALTSLAVPGFHTQVSRVQKNGLDCCDFDVVLQHDNHDHDMAYLHGHSRPGGLDGAHAHAHGDGHEGHHGHGHSHAHAHDHEHRTLHDVEGIIDAADMSLRAKQIATQVFRIVAQAEAKAHGTTPEEVHFHEVGAVDSIIDVVAAAVCLDDLDITACIVPRICEGTGTVRAQHGILPVPVPAVTHIVEQHGLSLGIMAGVEGEFVTPTGAAIAAAIKTSDALPDTFRIVRSGLGAGKRSYERPSILRAMIIETACAAEGGCEGGARGGDPALWKLETEVDDCTGETLGYLLDKLYDAGALEAHFAPVFMKKNRPGYQVEVLCGVGDVTNVENVLFMESTTIGVRRLPVWRTALGRQADAVSTPLGEVGLKTVVLPDGTKRSYPEHDSVARVAQEAGVSYQDAVRAVYRSL